MALIGNAQGSFSPVALSIMIRLYDTLGHFTHRYMPELTHVPNAFVQEP
ncbi:MAG: hypothetical protein MUQ55_01150 [Paracoccaceae bacterium]|nr:hypothetical protein [Paracoccaceae bacterium]MDO7708404.1 hypothetical protein [Paracoccaceae bacterium]